MKKPKTANKNKPSWLLLGARNNNLPPQDPTSVRTFNESIVVDGAHDILPSLLLLLTGRGCGRKWALKGCARWGQEWLKVRTGLGKIIVYINFEWGATCWVRPLTRTSGGFVDISLFVRLEEVLFRLRFCLLLLIGLVRVLTLGWAFRFGPGQLNGQSG